MYLLNTLHFDQSTQKILVENGLSVGVLEKTGEVYAKNQYWGQTVFYNCDYYCPIKREGFFPLPYVSNYEVEDIGDGFKRFHFNIGEFDPKTMEGYIVFIPISSKEILTNGKRLFGRLPSEIVVVLKNGQYVKFDDNEVTVVDNKLALVVDKF